MDRNSLIGIVLLVLLLVGYSMYMGTQQEEIPKLREDFEQRADLNSSESNSTSYSSTISRDPVNDSLMNINKYGQYFADFANGNEETLTIENDLLIAEISNKGASIVKWQLKNYNKWDGEPSQLIWPDNQQLYQEFLSLEGKRVDTRNLYFTFDSPKKSYSISGEQEIELKAYLKWDESRYIERTYRFFGDKYHLETEVRLVNLDNIIKNEYNFNWSGGLKYQEYNTIDESNEAEALVVMNEEVLTIDADDIEEDAKETLSGKLDYIGLKNKYFGAVITTNEFDGTVELAGQRKTSPNNGMVEYYDLNLRVPYNGGDQSRSFLVFIGPIESALVEGYGFSQMINYGWWLFRYIGQAFIQFFLLINHFIVNWGITIIVFSVILKFTLYPLTRPQMKSMQKMKVLQPEMQKIRDKYSDDMTKQQSETMKLYQEYGVNPFGGCLPLLLQMPILYTLWSVFRTNINLRQTEFIPGWIDDLSVPDTIIEFPFSILGLESLSGLALAMGVTMFLQQKLTVTDPRQKSMIYIMPVMFTFMFSNFPAGLNLYYFIFNLVSILQQLYWNKIAKSTITLQTLKQNKKPKKEGWLAKKMKEAQAIQEQRKGGGGPNNNLSKHQHTPKNRDTKRKKK
ncbi:membrane protein insertase YidC [Candidatus Kapabacteria bacterium]|nr:membrane protein insertase YidC [Candidatus Kapabacteria bacterium]